MAAENFSEFLNKLKEIHEKEVQGLQTKLNEITNDRCRDTQRIEELFAKNHQLREQQKVLKENVKMLENRLRAGLCDRCQVTQELAKKKLHEFGKAHFQSLQHIFILTNEMHKLREENKSLREDLKRICGMEDRQKSLKGLSRDGNSTPNSPLPLLSTQNRKPSCEKTPSQETEDEFHEPLGHLPKGDQSPRQKSSPTTRSSPSILLQGEHVLEKSSQKIANQLHGTIAVVKPGMRVLSVERDYARSASPPPASETPSSPQPDQSPGFEAYLRASKPDYHEIASSYETLKFATQKEQLNFLSQHFALHHLGVQNNSSSKEGEFPHSLLMAKEIGCRPPSRDEWEDQPAFLGFPGAVVYMKDRHLESRLQFLHQQEKLHYLLAQQYQHEGKAKTKNSPEYHSQRQSPSPSLKAGKECKRERSYLEESIDGPLRKFLLINREELEQAEKTEVAKDYTIEVPLDLSDYGRGRENLKSDNWQPSPMQKEARSPGTKQIEDQALQRNSLPNWNPADMNLHGTKEPDPLMVKVKVDPATSLDSSLQKIPNSKSDFCGTDSETTMPCGPQKEEMEYPDNEDSQSINGGSDEPDTSDSEVASSCNDERDSMKEMENIQRLHRKRKRKEDLQAKAANKKSAQGIRNGRARQASGPAHDAQEEMANPSPAFSHNSEEEQT